jgi:hypothetical protein
MQYNSYEEVKIDFDGCDSHPHRDLRLFPLPPGLYILPDPRHLDHSYKRKLFTILKANN